MSKTLDITETELTAAWLRKDLLRFTNYFFYSQYNRSFIVNSHHRKIADALNRVYNGKCRRLIINMPPRYGKTEIAVKNFVALGFAINPQAKFIHLSYSDDLARDNSMAVQSTVLSSAYQQLFPYVQVKGRSTKSWSTTSGGGLYAVASGGQVTGFGAGLVEDEEAMKEIGNIDGAKTFGGAIIIDDPIKPDDALSATVRDKVNNKFETTIRSRVNSRNTPIILIMQRVHEDDLSGYLMRNEPEEWEVLSLPAIYTDENGEEQPLWEFKHTLEELHKLRKANQWVFDTQYMQDAKPIQGLMYSEGFRTYETIPYHKGTVRKSYTDTADTGADYLCQVIYDELPNGVMYVHDVLYTQKPMEYTEPESAKMNTKWQVDFAIIESNNGGRGFCRNVESQCRSLGNRKTMFRWFHQTNNKEVRIFSHSAEVQNLIMMPVNWNRLFPDFYKAVMGYLKQGKNAHDDAPDVLTGMVENIGVGNGMSDDEILSDFL